MSQREAVVRGVYRTMFETGDTSQVATVVTDDVIDHAAPPGTPASGHAALAGVIAYLHRVLADITYEIEDVIEAGDRVAFRATLSARQVGDLFGFPATGRPFRMQQIHIVRFDGDRIAEHWACRDDLGALHQLGHVG